MQVGQSNREQLSPEHRRSDTHDSAIWGGSRAGGSSPSLQRPLEAGAEQLHMESRTAVSTSACEQLGVLARFL